MDCRFTSSRKCPMLLFLKWKIQDHYTYYCTTCYPIWIWKPWNSIEHKKLLYETGVWYWCRQIYVRYWWHGCIHQWGISIKIRRRCLGVTIPRIIIISWYGRCRESRESWKGCWHLWSVFRHWGMSTWWTREKMMARVTNHVKDKEGNNRGVEHHVLFV